MMDWEIPNYFDDKILQDGIIVSASRKLDPKSIKKLINNVKLHYAKVDELVKICPNPKKNEQYRIITEKQFNAFALILRIIQDSLIDEMYLAIYRINEPTVNAIIELIQLNKIKKGKFVISNFFNQTKKPEKWALKLKNFCDGNKNFDHVYVHNHSKVLACKSDDNYYVFEGSGNMSDNARIEQYLYENCKQSYDFHKQWILEL